MRSAARIALACATAAVAFAGILIAAQHFTPAFARDTSRRITKLTSQTIELPSSDRLFVGDKWSEVANARCLVCHSKGMIDMQPPMPLAAWKNEIHKMRSAYGAVLGGEDEVDGLAQFMYELNHAKQTFPSASAANAALEGR